MTPEEYVMIMADLESQMETLRQRASDARAQVEEGELPSDVRPATPSDITPGRVIWHKNNEGAYWRVVLNVLQPDDQYKAYEADDGCRHGLYNAFVRAL